MEAVRRESPKTWKSLSSAATSAAAAAAAAAGDTNHSQHHAGTYRYLMCMSGIGLLAIGPVTSKLITVPLAQGRARHSHKCPTIGTRVLHCPATAMHAGAAQPQAWAGRHVAAWWRRRRRSRWSPCLREFAECVRRKFMLIHTRRPPRRKSAAPSPPKLCIECFGLFFCA